jgi:hypothetical protein
MTEIYWEKSVSMRKFHAFTLDSAVSLCGRWFMGFKAVANDLDILPSSEQELAKCKVCKKRVFGEVLSSKGQKGSEKKVSDK